MDEQNTASTNDRYGRTVALLFSVFAIATCGLIYELLAGTIASYMLGDSVTQFSTIIGVYLFSMGLGSYLSRYFRRDLIAVFIQIEILVGLIGGFSSFVLFLAFAQVDSFRVVLYSWVTVTGILVGLEIPFVLRILKDQFPFSDLISKVLSLDYNLKGTAISLAAGPFKQSAIYEFTYVAKDPLVAGIGLAATRDFVSFLKYARADDYGNSNPLWRHARQVYAVAISQSARYLNDFQTLGFNADERDLRVIDGILNWIGAGNGAAINFRFAQTGRTERNRQNHRYPEANFPFAYPRLKDALTGKIGGRGVACAGNRERDRNGDDDGDGNACPKVLEVNSANEYWVKTASLQHTDTSGRDLKDPKNVRLYLLSSVEHTVAGSPANSAGRCQQFRNPTDPNPALRALFIALDEWVTLGAEPPKSEVPDHRTAAFSVPVGNGVGVIPQAALGWPEIPGVTYSGVVTVRHLLDFGPHFDDGIMDISPPDFSGMVYPAFVSKVDRDGNDIAGIRLPPVEAPIATTTGWALRSAAFGGGPGGNNMDGCEGSGQWIPFATTKEERERAGDPRKSLEERYGDHDGYVEAVTGAARMLEERRLLLPNDVQKYINAAEASSVLR